MEDLRLPGEVFFLGLRISFFFEEFVLAFGGFILEPLKRSDGLPSIFRAPQTAVDDGQLIPSLFDNIGVGVRSGRPLQCSIAFSYWPNCISARPR